MVFMVDLMATTVLDKHARLNIRVRPEVKGRIERAAHISGKTLTDFAVSILSESADGVLERHEAAKLSSTDREIFLRVLDERTKPNQQLLKARKSHKRIIAK